MYKNIIKDLERKVLNKTNKEEQLKKENESFRRQILFYQEKLKLELFNTKKQANISPPKKKVRFNETSHNITSNIKSNLDSSCLISPEKSVIDLKTSYKDARKKNMIKSAFIIPNDLIDKRPKTVSYLLIKPSRCRTPINDKNIVNNNSYQNNYTINITQKLEELELLNNLTDVNLNDIAYVLNNNYDEELELLEKEEEALLLLKSEMEGHTENKASGKNSSSLNLGKKLPAHTVPIKIRKCMSTTTNKFKK
jgi:hypothetical protein